MLFDSADNTFINCIVTGNTEAGSGVTLIAAGDGGALSAKVNCLITGDAKLGPLQNNGGPTLTMALAEDSPAIDAGTDAVLNAPHNLTTDQRR